MPINSTLPAAPTDDWRMGHIMHWMLECVRDAWGGGRSIESWPTIPGIRSWINGARFASPPTRAIAMYWDPADEAGPSLPLYKAGIPMMKRAVYTTLCSAGVDNIDIYDVEVRSHSSDDVDRSFVAFNIIGTVSAANMASSKIVHDGSPPLIAVPFDGVVIDPLAALDLPVFRLAENVTAIVVHDQIKQLLERQHKGLTFVRPEDWVG